MQFPNLAGQWYSNKWFLQVKSLQGFTGSQMFTNGKGYDRSYHLRRKGEAHQGLMEFIHNARTPQIMVTDNAQEEAQGDWGALCWRYQIKQEHTIPYNKWRNLAEAPLREVKVSICRAT